MNKSVIIPKHSIQDFLYNTEFNEDTENLIISSSSSDEEDLNMSLATDKCSVRDAILKSLKKKKKSDESQSSGKKCFENAELKSAIQWQLKNDLINNVTSPEIKVCKVS